jgi:hypothetical protein
MRIQPLETRDRETPHKRPTMFWTVSLAGSLAVLVLMSGLPLPSDSAHADPGTGGATNLNVASANASAQELTTKILADPTFMKTLPARTGKPMSAENINKTQALVKAKIASIRGAVQKPVEAGGQTAAIAGLGINLYNAMTAFGNKNMDREEAAKAVTSLIPLVGTGVSLGIAIKDKDSETTAVSAIALGSILIGAAVPMVGELATIGIVAYVAVKGFISWWKSTDAAERECIFVAAAIYRALAHPEETQCITYYKKWFNAVVSFFENLFGGQKHHEQPSSEYSQPPPKWTPDQTDGLGEPVPWWAAQATHLPDPGPDDDSQASSSVASAAKAPPPSTPKAPPPSTTLKWHLTETCYPSSSGRWPLSEHCYPY